MISTSVTTYFKSKEIINTNTAQYIIQTLKQTNGEIELKLQQFSNDASFLVDHTVQEYMNQQVYHQLSFQKKKALSLRVMQYHMNSPQIMEVAVYSIVGKLVVWSPSDTVIDGSPLSNELMETVRKLDARVYWKYAGTDAFKRVHLQGIRVIKNMLGPSLTPIGYLSFTVPEDIIYDSIKDLALGQTGQAIIVDADGTILSSQNRSWLGRQLDSSILKTIFARNEGTLTEKIEGRTYFIAFHTSTSTGWKTMGLVPLTEMTPGLHDVYTSNTISQSFWILFSILLSLLITRTVATPIKNLIRAMRGVESGDFSIQTNFRGNKEVFILSSSFNKMTYRLKELIQRVYEEELKEKSAQLRALQAQINPHFLYNTLDTIYWMLYLRGQEKIGDLIVSMSNMLRYSIGRNGPVVSLREELDNLFNYVHIQSNRYGDRITFEYDIDHSLDNIKVLKLMLQPAVENAITHGLEPSDKSGTIVIRVYCSEKECRIEISDNGVGIPKEKLAEYQERRQINHGLGIQNVDERIRLTFGENYGLTILSAEGQGTMVIFRLPLDYFLEK